MWQQFLSAKRIGSSHGPDSTAFGRSEFHRDYDRIIFSSAFRRLSDKTQVVPFPQSDYTRRRLTHSLEVSCVGRSLATHIYEMVRHDVAHLVPQGEFEAIVAAACLAHDIGNPPFGHFGERAIQEWAAEELSQPAYESLTAAQRADFTKFEGNAQSFRVLTRLQMSNRRGGMRLTAATLGALIKYPRPSIADPTPRYRKHGCWDDLNLFSEVFVTAGRQADECGQFARHPLALLSEAADDICYAIIDLEDGCRAGLIPADETFAILESIEPGCTGDSDMPAADRLSMGRAVVINTLVRQCVDVFRCHGPSILDGTFTGSLIDRAQAAAMCNTAKSTAFRKVYRSDRVVELEAAGYQAIRGLLNMLTPAALTDRPTGFEEHVRQLTCLLIPQESSVYRRLLACTDQISGMTDRYCIDLFRKLSGHAI